jgi:membrane protease YdiL (CAAX protease family)
MDASAPLGHREIGPLSLMRRYPLATFFVLAFALTWLVEIPMLAYKLLPLQLVVGYMPGLAAIYVTGATSGWTGISALLRRILIWRVGLGWYLLAIFGVVPIWFGAMALDPLLGGLRLPALSPALAAGWIALLILRLILSSEELAWRGFALPRLQSRHSALVASLIIGVIWSVWHLPLFFVPGSQADAGFPLFLAGIVALSVLFTWLFNNSRGSVLLCMLLHQALNATTDTFHPPSIDQVIVQLPFNALLVVAAMIVVVAFGPNRLSRKPAAEHAEVVAEPLWTAERKGASHE